MKIGTKLCYGGEFCSYLLPSHVGHRQGLITAGSSRGDQLITELPLHSLHSVNPRPLHILQSGAVFFCKKPTFLLEVNKSNHKAVRSASILAIYYWNNHIQSRNSRLTKSPNLRAVMKRLNIGSPSSIRLQPRQIFKRIEFVRLQRTSRRYMEWRKLQCTCGSRSVGLHSPFGRKETETNYDGNRNLP